MRLPIIVPTTIRTIRVRWLRTKLGRPRLSDAKSQSLADRTDTAFVSFKNIGFLLLKRPTRKMRSTLRLLLPVLFVLILTVPAYPVRAAATSNGVSVSVQSAVPHISYSVNIFQNLTALDSSFALPQSGGTVTNSNSTMLANTLQNALREKTPTAGVTSLQLKAISTPWSNVTSSQWLNITSSFDVDGIAANSYGGEQIDFAWRSFAVASNMTVAGLEINRIGSSYMPPIGNYIQTLKNTKLFTFTYRLNEQAFSQSRIPASLAAISIFNFSSLATPLDRWSSAYNGTTNTVTWSLRPALGFAKLPTYGLQVKEVINEATPTTVLYELSFGFQSVTITAPLRSTASGDRIVVTFGDSSAFLMVGVIFSALVLTVGTTIYEKRLLSNTRNKKK